MVILLEELGVSKLKPISLHCGNQSNLHIAHNPTLHERTKHIKINCHFTRDKVLEGLIQFKHQQPQSPHADVFTKVLPSDQFNKLLSKLGTCYLPQA